MNQDGLFAGLRAAVPRGAVLREEPMRRHTSFRIGGPAEFYVQPSGEAELLSAIRFLRRVGQRYAVIGNGTNLLVNDAGIRGVVIEVGRGLSAVRIQDTAVMAEAGILLSRLANAVLEHGLSGLEFAAGIPGSLGGAVVMNAGAYGGEMKDVVVCTRYFDGNTGEVREITGDAHQFGYRKSVFGAGDVVLSAQMELSHGGKAEIEALMKELNQRRKDKQPIELPSAGSTFKRPEGQFAGKLIADAGLAGYRVGGACVSEKHCGFVVNDKNATCADVQRLMEHIQQEVYRQFGVLLQPEVRVL